MRRPFSPAVLLALLTAIIVAACSADATSGERDGVRTVGASEAVRLVGSRTVIDVRSPGELAAGHLADALNIDAEAADFRERIASLDPEAPYLLYCRSGRRSAIAAGIMAEAGFTDIVDAGGLRELALAGAAVE
jgi:phage shock protein E